MTDISTAGIELRTKQRWLAEAVELASSMRFAISLLALIAIAAIIGTVMKQSEPMTNYVNQFGPFWFDVFYKFSLYSLYSAWWFLLAMGILVLSTSLCITRNAPKMLADMRSWRDNVREQSLQNFGHKAQWSVATTRPLLAQQLTQRIGDLGYQTKVIEKDHATLISAKRGAANKFGYIFAHSAIVIICIGGLLDSDLTIRFQRLFQGKVPFTGSGVIAQIPVQHRLGLGNPTFRGNTMIPEGSSSDTAIIQQENGVLIQDLPFTIRLKKFVVDFYSTGMPKLFASELEVRDHETGKIFSATVKVNQPLIYKGIAVYQSSFEDGGSKLKLTAYPMHGGSNQSFAIAGEVGATTPLGTVPSQSEEYVVEWSDFRPFNVENMQSESEVRGVRQAQSFNEKFAVGLDKRLGSAAKNANNKNLKNIGPNVQYKLRDKSGQAREFQNYMMSANIDGDYVFLAGMRDSPSEPFAFLRIPADENDTVAEWMRIRAAMMNPQLRLKASQQYAQHTRLNNDANVALLRQQLQQSALKSLDTFAGYEGETGYRAVARFLDKVPADQQEKAADIFMKVLNGSLWDLWQVARQQDGLPVVESNEKNARFLQLAGNAVSDAFLYKAPVFLQLNTFEEIKASVLQVSRSPGKNVVYLGCLFLVLGVFSMFYIRERRIWVWLKECPDGTSALMAMSSQRKTLDFEKEFLALTETLQRS